MPGGPDIDELRRRVARGREAAAVAAFDLFPDLRSELVKQWEDEEEAEKRNALWAENKALKRLLNRIRRLITDGDVAAKKIGAADGKD